MKKLLIIAALAYGAYELLGKEKAVAKTDAPIGGSKPVETGINPDKVLPKEPSSASTPLAPSVVTYAPSTGTEVSLPVGTNPRPDKSKGGLGFR